MQDSVDSPTPVPPRNAATLVWVAALSLHGKIYHRVNRILMQDFGITVAKYDVLAQLINMPDGLTLGALSQRLKVTGGNVTGLIHRLAEDGMIVREMSPVDRRSFIVRLLPKGRDTFIAAQARHDGLLQEWLGHFPPAELDAAAAVLRRMDAALA